MNNRIVKRALKVFLLLGGLHEVRAQQNTLGVLAGAERFSRSYDGTYAASFFYRRETSLGPLLGRWNYADRFQRTGGQLEAEWYPGIAKGMNGYLSYAYSANSLFPSQRAGLELFQSLPRSLEGSLGGRFLIFETGNDLAIYTASMAWYVASYYLVARVFLSPGSAGTTRALVIQLRKYFVEPDEFVFVRVGGGISPDEQSTQSSLGSHAYNLASQSIAAGWQSGFHGDILFEVQGIWTNQELISSPGDFVQSGALSAGMRFRF